MKKQVAYLNAHRNTEYVQAIKKGKNTKIITKLVNEQAQLLAVKITKYLVDGGGCYGACSNQNIRSQGERDDISMHIHPWCVIIRV